MSENWFYELDGKQTGPIDKATLQLLLNKNVINLKTLVWTEGLDEWIPASRVKGLVSAPPPLPASSASAPKVTGPAPVIRAEVRVPEADVPELESDHPDTVSRPKTSGQPIRPRTATGKSATGMVKRQKDDKPTGKRGSDEKSKPANSDATLYYVFGGVTLLVILAVIYVVFLSGPKPQPVATTKKVDTKQIAAPVVPKVDPNVEPVDPPQRRVWLLERYDRDLKAAPENFTLQRERLDFFDTQYPENVDWVEHIKRRRDALRVAMEKKADQIVESMRIAAAKKLDEYKYKEALAEFDKFPMELNRTDASDRVARYRVELNKKSDEQAKSLGDRTTELVTKKDYDGALALLDKIADYGTPTVTRMVTARRAEIADIKKVGVNPSEGKIFTLSDNQAWMKSDCYIGLPGMLEKYQTAITAALSGNTPDALSQTDTNKFPRSAIYYYVRGIAQSREGSRAEATWNLEQAARLAAPNDAFKSRMQSANIRLELIDLVNVMNGHDFQQRIDEINAMCEAALKTDPKNADAHFAQGMLFYYAGNFGYAHDEADLEKYKGLVQEHWKQAAELDSTYKKFANGAGVAGADKYSQEGTGGNPYLPGVVQIIGSKASGSGWCVAVAPGISYIITNNHVIDQNPSLKVVYQLEAVGNLIKKTSKKVKILKIDVADDLALLEVATEKPLMVLPIRQTTDLKVPLNVTLIGSPGAEGVSLDFTVMPGQVSNRNRVADGTRHLQLNSNLDHGMSGGPVIDEKGIVIGVMVAKYNNIQGQGLAIIAEHVRDICEECGLKVELRKE